MVVKSRKKTSDSRMASSIIVPARTADKRDGTKGQGGGASPLLKPCPLGCEQRAEAGLGKDLLTTRETLSRVVVSRPLVVSG